MQNLLIYGISSLHGGVETFIFNLVEYLDQSKFKIFLLMNTPNYANKEWLDQQAVSIIIGPNRKDNVVTYESKLRTILREHQIDIVWSNLTSLSDVSLLSAAKKEGVKKRIVYSHQSSNMGGSLTGLMHQYNKKFVLNKVCTHYWACSDLAWNYFYLDVFEFDSRDVFVNAVSIDKYKFDPNIREIKRKELDSENNFVLGTVGRLTTEKNQKFLIQLIDQLKKQILNIKCFIVGTGVKHDELNELISELDLKGVVELLGQRTDVSALMNAFDIFVLPSLFEGLPFVLVEAQMNGLDVLVSDQVSLESGFTNKIVFLELDLNLWQEKILEIHQGFNRQAGDYSVLEKSQFNIHNFIKEIESRLMSIR